jgi:thiamine-phosphate pyrophosphorylase
LDAGVRLVQLRAKRLSFGPALDLADRLSRQAAAAGAWFVLNDRADVARLSGATGVHVGQDDLSVAEVRQLLWPGQRVGVSTHNDVELARVLRAPAGQVDYVAAGPVFATTSKQNPDPAIGITGIRAAVQRLRPYGLPLVAIGGMTLATAPAVLEAGADAVAVIGDLLTSQDPGERVRQWLSVTG